MTKKGNVKKGLSLFLALMMLLGNAWLFAGLLGPTADAAEIPVSYNVHAYIQVNDNMDNCNLTATLYGRANNGKATSETNMGSFTWNDEDTEENKDYDIVNGLSAAGVFPTRINLHLDSTKYYIDRTTKLYIHLIVQGIDMYLQATVNSYKAEELSADSGTTGYFYWKTADILLGGKENYFDVDYKVTSAEDLPYAKRINTPTGAQSITIPRTGASSYNTTYSATVMDQYGVKWYQNPTFYVNKSFPTSVSSITSTSNRPTGCSITNSNKLTVTSAAQIAGSQNFESVYLTALCENAWSSLYVILNDPLYTVTYKKYDGSGASTTESVAYGDNGTIGEPLLERTGYTFMGWNTSANQKTGEFPKMNVTSNLTLYEAWAPNTYSVAFARNGGTGNMSAQAYEYDQTKALSENSYARYAELTLNQNYYNSVNPKETSEYDFDGWDGEDFVYDTATYTKNAAGSDADVKRYDVAAPAGGFKQGDRYVFEFDAKGSGTLLSFFYGAANYMQIAKAECSTGTVTNGTDGNMPITLTGDYKHYTVTYTIGSTGTATVTKYLLLRAQSGANVTVTGIKAHRIYADQDSFTMEKDWNYEMTARWIDPDPIELPAATRQFFTFDGWYEDAACKTKFGDAGDEKLVLGKKTVYAKWNPVSFNITYVEGLEGETTDTVEYKYNTGNQAQKLKRPDPSTEVPAGYTFTGWKVTAADSGSNWQEGTVYPGGMTTKNAHGNITLRAQYEINSYETVISIEEGGALSNLPAGAELQSDGSYKFTSVYGDSFSFNVTLSDGYNTATPDVYRENCNYTLSGSGSNYTVTVSEISGPVVVHVTPNPLAYSVSVNAGEGVGFDPENATLSVSYNENATFDVTLLEGYKDLVASIGETELTPTNVSGSVYTFTVEHVTEAVTVDVSASPITFTVDIIAPEGAAVSPSGSQEVRYGESLSFTVEPAVGFTSEAPVVTVKGSALAAEDLTEGVYTYTVANITEDTVVSVSVTPNVYTVTVNTDSGLEPVTPATVQHGGSYTLVLSLKEGFEGSAPTARIGDTPVVLTAGADGKYTGTIENVTEDIVIDAASTRNAYIVTISGDEGATLSDAAFNDVPHGTTVSFTVTLKEHYTNTPPAVTNAGTPILPVNIDGNVYTYEVTVTGDMTINVATAFNTYLISFVLPESGKLLWSTTVNEGATPAYEGEAIDTVWDDNKHYVFTNVWTPDFVPATEDKMYFAVVEGSAHDWVDGSVLTEPMCFTAGEKEQHCAVCGATRTVEIDPIGHHAWNEGEVTTLPTCTDNGVKTYTCTVCGETRTEPVNAMGHLFTAWQDNGENHIRYCARENCGYSETAAHNWDEGTVNEGFSCITGGERTFTCLDCGKTKAEPINPNEGHEFGEWVTVKEGSDEHQELQRRTCANCGAIQERTIVFSGEDPHSDPEVTKPFNLFDFLKNFIMRVINFFKQLRF